MSFFIGLDLDLGFIAGQCGRFKGGHQNFDLAKKFADSDYYFTSKLEQCEAHYREGTVFAYRNLVPIAEAARKQALEESLKVLDQRMKANRSSLTQFLTDRRNEVARVRSEVSRLEAQANSKATSYRGSFGCLEFIGSALSGLLGLIWWNLTDLHVLGIIAFIIAGVLVFIHPVLKLMTATVPAADLSLKAEREKQEADSLASQADARIADATRHCDTEFEQLKQQRENCQTRIGEMFPANICQSRQVRYPAEIRSLMMDRVRRGITNTSQSALSTLYPRMFGCVSGSRLKIQTGENYEQCTSSGWHAQGRVPAFVRWKA